MISVFAVQPEALGEERAAVVDETATFLKQQEDNGVVVRGLYDVAGFRADADFMIWTHAERVEDLQATYSAFRRTALGLASDPVWSVVALHRPAEFNKSHVPAFIAGEEPGDYLCVYPFVRSLDWYLLPDDERRKMLVEHGMAGREYPDVRANTVPAFALGDYEWILAFEGPDLRRIVELMWKLRYTDARRHVREETPFFTGPRGCRRRNWSQSCPSPRLGVRRRQGRVATRFRAASCDSARASSALPVAASVSIRSSSARSDPPMARARCRFQRAAHPPADSLLTVIVEIACDNNRRRSPRRVRLSSWRSRRREGCLGRTAVARDRRRHFDAESDPLVVDRGRETRHP